MVLQHESEPDRLDSVKQKMRLLGSPRVAVFQLRDGRYLAAEGVHRLTAAHQLNMRPVLLRLESQDHDVLWVDVVEESFAGERELCRMRVRDMIESLEDHVKTERTDLPALYFSEFDMVSWSSRNQD